MRNSKESLFADVSLMAFLFLVFISVLFIAQTPQYIVPNIIALSGIFFIAILTYFTNLTTGLILAICIDFISLSLCLYISVTKGIQVRVLVYFWVVILPLVIIAIGNFIDKTVKLQETNVLLNRRLEELMILDEPTGLKNGTAFVYDAGAYMNIARRYGHDLVLMVVGIRYPREIEHLVGVAKMEQLIVDLSTLLEESTRKEDVVYIIDHKEALWGILMMTNDREGMSIVSGRVRDKVNNMHLEGHKKGRGIKIELVIGQSLYTEHIETPVALLEAAKRQMQYDVQ